MSYTMPDIELSEQDEVDISRTATRSMVDRANEMLRGGMIREPQEREQLQRLVYQADAQINPWNNDDVSLPPSWGEIPSSRSNRNRVQMADNAHEARLAEATRKIIEEMQPHVTDEAVEVGRREGQYLELIRNQKKEGMLAYEIVHSEFPVNLASVARRKLDEIVLTRSCPDIHRESEGSRPEFRCARCALDTPAMYAFFCDGHLYCSEHVPNLNHCSVCNGMQEGCTDIDTFDGREIFACQSCISRGTYCRNCSVPITPEYIEYRMCENCIEQADPNQPYRKFSMGLRWCGTPKGKIMKSTRMFSCEVEALSPERNAVVHIARTLPKECGISTDSSVQGRGEKVSLWGFELQTPRLSGKKGEECVERMNGSLRGVKAVVNESCGMHIHLDGRGISLQSRREFPTALLQLWKAHLIFEDVIMSFLPYKRRRNDFCRPMNESFKLVEIETCSSVLDAEKLWYKERTYNEIREAKGHHYHSSRYFGVNFHSLLGHGHLEIRYHSGTINSKKILEWANLHALIMDAAAKKIITYDFLREAQQTSVLREKTEMLFDKIGLEEASRQYFRSRQKKFSDKTEVEGDEVAQQIAPVVPATARAQIIGMDLTI